MGDEKYALALICVRSLVANFMGRQSDCNLRVSPNVTCLQVESKSFVTEGADRLGGPFFFSFEDTGDHCSDLLLLHQLAVIRV